MGQPRLERRKRMLELVQSEPLADHWRPSTRDECPEERPCPYVGCRYNNYLDVTRCGSLRIFWSCCPTEVPPHLSCSLDVAAEGEHYLDEVAKAMGGVSRERIRQVEEMALRSLSRCDDELFRD